MANKLTKAQHRSNTAAWRLALAEGRVIRVSDTSFKSYPTAAATMDAVVLLRMSGYDATVVHVPQIAR